MKTSQDRRASRVLVPMLIILAVLATRGLLAVRAKVATVGELEGSTAAAALPTSVPELEEGAPQVSPGRVVPGSASAWLQVVDRETLEPLRPHELLVSKEGSEGVRLDCSGSAVALREELLGACVLRATVGGYVPLEGRIDLVPGENRLMVQRAGGLVVSLADASGAPAEGVDLVLLAPREGREAGSLDARPVFSRPPELARTPEGWTLPSAPVLLDDGSTIPRECSALARSSGRRTDASGRAEWEDVPARAGYRWAIASSRHVDPSPPHEQVRFVEIGGALRMGPPPPPGVSGSFTILPGETLELTGAMLAGVAVRGRIACSAADSPARVTLYRIDVGGGDSAKRAVSFEQTATRPTGEQGEFEFTALRPGSFLVRAWWMEEREELYSASRTFRLEAGSDLDLGLLSPLIGDSLEVTVGIADQDGQKLEPWQVYLETGRPLFANFAVTATPSDGDATHLVSGILPLPFGRPFRIHGLQPGRVFACAQPGEGLVEDPNVVSRVEGAPAEVFDVGERGSLELLLVAHVGSSRMLVVRDPDGYELAAPSVWVHERSSGSLSFVPTRNVREGEGQARALVLPPGVHDLLVKLRTDVAPDGLVGSANVVIDPLLRDPIEIVLRPAVRVTGVLRDSSGAPIAGERLSWTIDPWPLEGGGPALYTATTDESGRFSLHEVPPKTPLRGARRGTDLPALDPGPHEGIELVARP